jgi:hypothetical protein
VFLWVRVFGGKEVEMVVEVEVEGLLPIVLAGGVSA